jgi:hypothetical protein
MDELIEHFSSLEDPRCPGKITYPLLDILAITVCAVIAGAARNLALLRKMPSISSTAKARSKARCARGGSGQLGTTTT